MADKLSKLSLLARFDDMSRFQNSISLNEKLFNEMKRALDYCEKMRTRCINVEKELTECRARITVLENDKVKMDKKFNKLQTEYDNVYNENKKLEKELSDLKLTINEFNVKTQNYHDTADQTQLLIRLNRLRKASDSDSGCIESPSSEKKEISTTVIQEHVLDNEVHSDGESEYLSQECIIESPNELTPVSSFSFINKHNFERRIVFSTERIKCLNCANYIELYSRYNFCDECKSAFHDNCINDNYCYGSKKFYLNFLKLSELSSKQYSLIQLLINSFEDIEKRALEVEKIYIVKCCLKTVERSFLNLLDGEEYSEFEVHTLCNIVLYLFELLMELNMPLISETSLNYFLSNPQVITENQINTMFYNLEHKAQQYMFIRSMIHLQNILKNNDKNRVSANMLARVWASKLFNAKELAEKKGISLKAVKHLQSDLMIQLLNISMEYWNKLLFKISSFEQVWLPSSLPSPPRPPPPPPPPPPKPKPFQNINSITPLLQRNLKPNYANFQSPLSYQTAISSMYTTPVGNRMMGQN